MFFRLLLWIYTFAICNQVSGQLVQKHIINEQAYNLRTLDTKQFPDTIDIPFWDDFSTGLGQPNPELWINSENVLINSTLGANPPTLNVATFDGTDATGNPYDINSQFVANTDNLTSRAIDLSNIVANKLNTVFVSFFWQARGNGEVPNETDSLRLQFLNSDSLWVTQFNIVGGETALRFNNDGEEIFTQEILPITGPEYLHEGFRFRFQSFGRLTGGFDTWHIDYVFLNQDRDFGDLIYFDRGITSTPTSIFGDYSSIPSDQYFQSPASFVDSVQFELFNLDALPHPIEFSLNVYDLVNGILVDRTNEPTTAPILSGFERRVLSTNVPDLSSLSLSDSIVLETEVIYNTGDRNLIQFINPVSGDTTFYDNVDYKVNDTLRRQFTIQNFLAYDDGTAEFAAGINQIRGQLAYQYFIPSSDSLTDIDIYFPRIAPSAEGLPIEIVVWRRLADGPGNILAKQPFTIQQQPEMNQFTRYTLEFPIIVRDTIYIGWEQFSDNFIGVGLDKNSDTGDRVFLNVDGEWRQNVGIEGSLMLRPVFRKAETAIITSVEREISINEINIYPNPNQGIFEIQGDFDHLRIYDLLGRSVPFKLTDSTVELGEKRPGGYIISFTRNNETLTRRMILSD